MVWGWERARGPMRAPRSVPRPSPAGSDKGRVGAEAVGGCVLTPPLCFLQYDQHVISPKEFVHLAGKSTLKDWKRAIRMNGIMLRWAAGRAARGGLGEAACWRPGRATAHRPRGGSFCRLAAIPTASQPEAPATLTGRR